MQYIIHCCVIYPVVLAFLEDCRNNYFSGRHLPHSLYPNLHQLREKVEFWCHDFAHINDTLSVLLFLNLLRVWDIHAVLNSQDAERILPQVKLF